MLAQCVHLCLLRVVFLWPEDLLLVEMEEWTLVQSEECGLKLRMFAKYVHLWLLLVMSLRFDEMLLVKLEGPFPSYWWSNLQALGQCEKGFVSCSRGLVDFLVRVVVG